MTIRRYTPKSRLSFFLCATAAGELGDVEVLPTRCWQARQERSKTKHCQVFIYKNIKNSRNFPPRACPCHFLRFDIFCIILALQNLTALLCYALLQPFSCCSGLRCASKRRTQAIGRCAWAFTTARPSPSRIVPMGASKAFISTCWSSSL